MFIVTSTDSNGCTEWLSRAGGYTRWAMWHTTGTLLFKTRKAAIAYMIDEFDVNDPFDVEEEYSHTLETHLRDLSIL